MAFTVEDGNGIADANAYVAVSFVDTYFLDRGDTTWSGTSNSDKQIAIIKATDYIDRRFGRRFLGEKEFDVNILEFPRLYLYDRDGNKVTGIPTKLKQAVSEYALRAISANLMPDPVVDDRGQIVTRKIEKVGPLEEWTHYWASQKEIFKSYPTADKLLLDYMTVGGVSR